MRGITISAFTVFTVPLGVGGASEATVVDVVESGTANTSTINVDLVGSTGNWGTHNG